MQVFAAMNLGEEKEWGGGGGGKKVIPQCDDGGSFMQEFELEVQVCEEHIGVQFHDVAVRGLDFVHCRT